jgi:hypothetical protein
MSVGEVGRLDQLLIGIAAPVGERDRVALDRFAECGVQSLEVRPTVDQEFDTVADGPRESVTTAPVDLGRSVASVGRIEEPRPPDLVLAHRRRA